MKRTTAFLLTLCLALCGVLCIPYAAPPAGAETAAVDQPGYYLLRAETALRETPGGKKLCTLPAGALLRVTQTDGGNGKLQWDGLTGWAPLKNCVYKSPFKNKNGKIGLMVDVSVFNPADQIDWNKLKAAGVTGAILRVAGRGYGPAKSLYTDTAFLTHYKNATAAGLPVGAYFFSFALTEAQAAEEAQTAIDIFRKNRCELRLPVFIDIEGYSGDTQHRDAGKAVCSAVVDTFCNTVADAGYYPGICTYTYFAQTLLEDSVFLPGRAVWMADYRDSGIGYAGRYDIWQFSGSGRLPGAPAAIDLDLCYTDFPALIEKYGKGCAAGKHRKKTQWETVDEGSCVREGVRVKTCVDCGAVLETERFPGTEHDWLLTETVPATCGSEGSAFYVCRNDETHVKTEVLPKTPHDWVRTKTVKATCGSEGSRTYVCRNDATHVKTVVLPMKEHAWVLTETVAPTCGKRGKEVYVCANDAAHVQTVALPKTPHEWELAETVPATCSGEGKNVYVCKNDPSHVKTELLPLAEHDWQVSKTVPATCETDGEITYVCRNDATHVKTETLPKTGHDWALAEAPRATCTGAGKERWVCKNDPAHVKEETVPKTGHAWELTETVPPTCTKNGKAVYVCKNDAAHVKTEKLPKTGHSWALKESVPATCSSRGKNVYVCENDETHVKRETLPLTKHVYGKWITLYKPTFYEEGLRARACTVCSHEETALIPKREPPAYIPGDVNDDGVVSAEDARLALRAAVGLKTYSPARKAFLAADADADALITAEDARLILRAAVGLQELRPR